MGVRRSIRASLRGCVVCDSFVRGAGFFVLLKKLGDLGVVVQLFMC